MKVKTKKPVLCHCCHKPAVDYDGKPKNVGICPECIRWGGSVGRKCSKHAKPPETSWDVRLWLKSCEERKRWSWEIVVFRKRSLVARAIIRCGFLTFGTKEEASNNAAGVANELGLPHPWTAKRAKR